MSRGDKSAWDQTTHAGKTITVPHEMIHCGDAFHCHYVVAVSDTDFRTAITFQTPNTTKWAHMVASVHATDAAVAYLYEAVIIDGGTAGEPVAVTIYNRNRNSTETSGFISQHATPVTGGASGWTEALLQDAAAAGDANWAKGTAKELDRFPLGGGTNPVQSIGGTERGQEEWLLDQNTVYMVMIQSSNANDNTHVIRLDWYEHTNL